MHISSMWPFLKVIRDITMHSQAAKIWTNQSQETKLFLGSTQPCRLRCPRLCRDRSCGEQCLGLVTVFPTPTFLGPQSYTVDTLKGAVGQQHHQSVSLSVRSSFPYRFARKKQKHLPADGTKKKRLIRSRPTPHFAWFFSTKHKRKNLTPKNARVIRKFCQHDDAF